MSSPIEYAIVRDLQAALQAATVAGGYYYTIAATAVKLDPNHDAEDMVKPSGPRPFVLIEVLPDEWDYSKQNEAILVQKLALHWTHDSDPTVDEDMLLVYFRGCADVEKAITQDITRGGRAVDTKITARTPVIAAEGGKAWATLNVDIRTHREYGVPSEA